MSINYEISSLRRAVRANKEMIDRLVAYLGGPQILTYEPVPDDQVLSQKDLAAFNKKCRPGESVADAISQTPLSGSPEHKDTPF